MKHARLAALSVLIILFVLPITLAATDYQDLVAQQAGINPDQLNNIPKTPEEAKDALLKQSWTDLIAKNKYLGPVNSFFTVISPVFLVLFGENYSLSPALLLVIILWFYVAMELTILFNGIGFLNSWANRGIAVGCSIVLAQIGVYRGIGLFLENLIYSPQLWYVRIIIALGLFVGLFILHYIMKMLEKQLKATKKASKEQALKGEVEKEGEFIKGIKEGTKLGRN